MHFRGTAASDVAHIRRSYEVTDKREPCADAYTVFVFLKLGSRRAPSLLALRIATSGLS